MVHFPVSGVEVNPLVPLLAAFAVSALTAPVGVSGAFLLLPFQVSVLRFTSPAVSPTNLVYNVVATPGGVYRYVREGRVVWPLAWAVIGRRRARRRGHAAHPLGGRSREGYRARDTEGRVRGPSR